MHFRRFVFALLVCAAPSFAQGAGTLEKIKSSGIIAMGHRESSIPFSYYDDRQQVVGYSQDIALRIVDVVKKELKLSSLQVKLVPVTSQNRIPLVQNGTVDIECGSTTNNLARQKDVDFLHTTYVEEVRIATKASSGINTIKDLTGKTVATTTGTTSVQLLRKHERANGVDFKEIFGKDHADSFLLLDSGRADAFVMDDNILAGNIVNAKNPAEFKIVGETLSEEPIAIMYRKDDANFKKVVDNAVMSMMKSGEIEKLYNKWFTSPIPPRNVSVNMAMTPLLKNAIANPNDKPAEDYAKK